MNLITESCTGTPRAAHHLPVRHSHCNQSALPVRPLCPSRACTRSTRSTPEPFPERLCHACAVTRALGLCLPPPPHPGSSQNLPALRCAAPGFPHPLSSALLHLHPFQVTLWFRLLAQLLVSRSTSCVPPPPPPPSIRSTSSTSKPARCLPSLRSDARHGRSSRQQCSVPDGAICRPSA